MDARKLIAALSNKDVTDAFAAAILPAIITTIDEKMSDTVTELKSVIVSLREEVKSKISLSTIWLPKTTVYATD